MLRGLTRTTSKSWLSDRSISLYQSKLNEAWGIKAALGFDWIVEFDNEDKGIGVGADQIAPLVGAAFIHFSSSWC